MNGQPVLARVAANDIKLLSNSEVAMILEKGVQIKAERKNLSLIHLPFCINYLYSTNHILAYLKDPQSTPLIPAATMSSDRGSTVLSMFSGNAYIFIACATAIFITILLLMGLMVLLGSTDKKQKREIKK